MEGCGGRARVCVAAGCGCGGRQTCDLRTMKLPALAPADRWRPRWPTGLPLPLMQNGHSRAALVAVVRAAVLVGRRQRLRQRPRCPVALPLPGTHRGQGDGDGDGSGDGSAGDGVQAHGGDRSSRHCRVAASKPTFMVGRPAAALRSASRRVLLSFPRATGSPSAARSNSPRTRFLYFTCAFVLAGTRPDPRGIFSQPYVSNPLTSGEGAASRGKRTVARRRAVRAHVAGRLGRSWGSAQTADGKRTKPPL